MKHLKQMLFAAVVAMSAVAPVYGQCAGGQCRYRSIAAPVYGRQVVGAYQYGGWYGAYYGGYSVGYGICYSGQCGAYAQRGSCSNGCAPRVQTPKPCEPATATYKRAEVCDNHIPSAGCDEYAPMNIDGKTVLEPCPNGECPLRRKAKEVAQKRVATLLDRANALRARYGLPALTNDANLETGAQYQAQICARIGGLQHGSGVAEVLAMNGQGLETALNQWLNSPAHRALLLNGSYRFGGVGIYRDGYGRAWCAMRFR